MKIFTLTFCSILLGATAANAELINRRNQCERWEYIPANEILGSAPTALLFCSQGDKIWLSLRVECVADEKRIAITYSPGFRYELPAFEAGLPPETVSDKAATILTDEAAETQLAEALFAAIPLGEPAQPQVLEFSTKPRDMVFFDFKTFGYTSVAYFDAPGAWRFFEPEPQSPLIARLISGNFADISLLATGTTERLPLRGSSKALRPIVETCRKGS